ncbi:aldolase [Amycolatopsis acidicola]|uniref:Aldolase n=1 Tax=Amycolatopsis acidicola TaxID=2596893 RepID=A0A5N0UW92_9PSEU|nr:aldolase/citrate lyase family protein [Amycolatopsis acidicola]KAA9156956.1 aldolase [Amycolatopsis acidicola]
MARLNSIIRALESGQHAFAAFAAPEPAAALDFANTDYDGLVFEAEHKAWDATVLRDSLQYLLDRRRIFEGDTLAPSPTPLIRVPVNGAEYGQWHAKQALDLGAFGVVWPHVTTVEEARNAVAACRYPRLPGEKLYEPAGVRGDAPTAAARYWGISNQEYYRKADVWPLDPDGEILVVLMIEDQRGIENLPDILKQVPGIGMVLIGEGDLSQELGVPRQLDHPKMVDARRRIVGICKENDVVVGHPHVTANNVEQVLEDGYRFLMSAPVRTFPGLEKGRKLTGRS